MKAHLKTIEIFLKSSHFYRGVRLTFAVVTPLILFYFIGDFEFALPIVMGAFLNAPGDIPGSLKRKVNAILISTALTMLIFTIILFCKPYLPLLVIVMAAISFFVSLLSVYGFRASLVSFSGLLAMVLAFAVEKETAEEILPHVLLMGCGGLWYLMVSFLFRKLAPTKDEVQFLSETLTLIGEYLQLRARLLTKKTKRQELMQEAFVLQSQINEKHETLRELLLLERKRSGRSHYDEKHMLIFISSVNIFELVEAKHLDYNDMDRLFKDRKYLKASKNLNKAMGNQLKTLSDLLIKNDKVSDSDILLDSLSQVKKNIAQYIEDVQLPKAREGALVLRNLYDYQEHIAQEIRAIRRVMANVKDSSKVSLKRQDTSKFLTLQEYRLNVIIQNFSLNSTLFRHALRFTVAMVFAFVLGTLLDIRNTYWILLTIIVIMRPNYGLTKERSKDRIVGTLIGAAFAIGIVLLTQNVIVYAVLAIISLTLAFSLVQQNYKSSAAFVTINIVFVYSLINPDAFQVIQYRVIDTVLGASIAVIANYVLWPSWEALNLKNVLVDALKKNQKYLIATQNLYHDKRENELAYKIARKEAFLAISNLNSAFQRMTQDPKSKQKEFQLIYGMVTLNQTMVSAIASIGSFIINHKTTPASKEFDALILRIANTLQSSCSILNDTPVDCETTSIDIEKAQDKLMESYHSLSRARDEDILKGETELDTESLHHLQEAYLISNQLIWLKTLSENLKKATIKFHDVI
ncbi:putative membrane protein (TIGR01666 family) [Gelidibacter sediminis]|uniref:Putative membrane protein (TIGR01666 family) n=1 Tax=Gelidibacter sediminis TaxID=1608710 RepID=A0A4V3F927_9FLAO|nr:FUSC family membrane protein [Gelidibacter sediminis]TDU39386.1 putative membrane protein (TIGR01666 family) [Gelidibacter sediminis]